jgi:hypothetical protein
MLCLPSSGTGFWAELPSTFPEGRFAKACCKSSGVQARPRAALPISPLRQGFSPHNSNIEGFLRPATGALPIHERARESDLLRLALASAVPLSKDTSSCSGEPFVRNLKCSCAKEEIHNVTLVWLEPIEFGGRNGAEVQAIDVRRVG